MFDIDMLYKHAEVCYKLGQHDKAIDNLEKILIFESQRNDALELMEKITGELKDVV